MNLKTNGSNLKVDGLKLGRLNQVQQSQAGVGMIRRVQVGGEIDTRMLWSSPYERSHAVHLTLSPLEYQWHAERTGRPSVKSQWGCEHHLRCNQTLLERRYAGIALFESLASKFRLLLDLNFIS